MKTNFLKVSSLFLLAGAMMLTSCKTTQKVTPQSSGEVEVLTPCFGPEYQSNSKALRFSAIGESMDQMTAKKKAMSEARAGLAAAINTVVKAVTDNYVKSGNYNNKEELMKNYEGVTREVVNQTLAGTMPICEKTMMQKDGTYKYYVCLELGGSEILQSINNKMTNNEMLKVDYNYEKFKKTFDEEMSKTGN
jgi:outer membrane protein assembly factor BamE (lipoprotein component of BamABCDE complex)